MTLKTFNTETSSIQLKILQPTHDELRQNKPLGHVLTLKNPDFLQKIQSVHAPMLHF